MYAALYAYTAEATEFRCFLQLVLQRQTFDRIVNTTSFRLRTESERPGIGQTGQESKYAWSSSRLSNIGELFFFFQGALAEI